MDSIKDDENEFKKIMTMSKNDLTPLDVAGKHRSHESAILIMDKLFQSKKYITKIYGLEPQKK